MNQTINADSARNSLASYWQRLRVRIGYWRELVSTGGRGLLLLSIVWLGLHQMACVKTLDICYGDEATQSAEDCDAFGNVQIVDSRFELTEPAQRAQDYWLRSGDQLKVSWSEYNILSTAAGTNCDFNSPAPLPSYCKKFWVCDQVKSDRDCLCIGPVPGGEVSPFLATCEGGSLCDSPTRLETLDMLHRDGCASFIRGVNDAVPVPHIFTPTENATFQLKLPAPGVQPPIFFLKTLAETKTFVLAPGGVCQTIAYPLSQLTQNTPDAVFYKGNVPGDPILEDNFSPNLHITKVRVLKGTSSRDPVTGKLQLANASVVHPSRIVLISAYDGGEIYQGSRDSTRCYTDASADGDLDFTKCRAAPGVNCNANTPSCRQPATPTSLAGSADLLTWVAEFKPSEGGIAPTLLSGQILAIEFKIEAN